MTIANLTAIAPDLCTFAAVAFAALMLASGKV